MSYDNIRKMINLFENNYSPKYVNDDIQYEVEEKKNEITKVTAKLRAKKSEAYTKLGNNLKKIEELTEEIKKIKDDVKSETKELLTDLFHAEDEAYTRVVETVSFTFQLSKKPEETKTYQYAKILEELKDHMTPDLIVVLNSIKEKYKSVAQREASLKYTDKRVEFKEGFMSDVKNKIVDFFKRFLDSVKNWGKKYDSKLDNLKSMAENEGLLTENHDGDDMIWASTSSGRIEIGFTKGQLDDLPMSGNVDAYVHRLSLETSLKKQLDAIDPEVLKDELAEYGAWDDEELEDHEENLQKILWLLGSDANENREEDLV